ncbi:MAG TPA: CcoQ/FixQ family Cbb3-type cytochrome c oxidase assembly chaperone [Bacteroidia bacterium]|nr:CcoQ/FixQ family Cbb3-type cytochrome c oxidase assembly chaperone [Bacteroidia bacterium]
MKFINYLTSISEVEIFPMISLMVFFVFFILVGLKVYMMDKQNIEEAENLPLENDKKVY